MHRLSHKHEEEAELIMKRQQWARMEPNIPSNFDFEEDMDLLASSGPVAGFTSGVDRSISSPRRRKDEKMADNDPQRYCADRCVATGNCDVYEVRRVSRYCNSCSERTSVFIILYTHNFFALPIKDMFDMDPREVIKFCNECVLSEDEEPCDIPESMFASADNDDGLNPSPSSEMLHP